MSAAKTPHDLLPLTPAVFHILLALADQERHGYGIMKEVEAQTDGEMLLRPGTLYQAIKRMLELGLIEESDERPDPALDDQRRRYYKLSALGRKTAAAEADRLQKLVRLVGRKKLTPAS
ncbi:MAG: helix-turn-helix transcriptional regulator [Anaerolineales bacterium]|nr:MAG: helix-turn-helix transcriptional regulator [Anaerolineales bacterium]